MVIPRHGEAPERRSDALSLSPRAVGAGALAGCVATLPMTVTMEALYRTLPPGERYPLPPSELVAETVELGLLGEKLPRRPHTALTLLAHFSYGAATGALFGPLARRLPLPTIVSGAASGVALWAMSYLLALPAIGLLRPTSRWPGRRALLMLAAHLVWGTALRLVMDRLDRAGTGAQPRAT